MLYSAQLVRHQEDGETAQRTSQGVEMDGESAENAGMNLLIGAELRSVPSGRLKSLLGIAFLPDRNIQVSL